MSWIKVLFSYPDISTTLHFNLVKKDFNSIKDKRIDGWRGWKTGDG